MEGKADKARIVQTLLDFTGRQLKTIAGTRAFTSDAQANPQVEQFTPIAEANYLLVRDAFAYLVALILNRGVQAQRAWEGPWLLKQRLGHLDPPRIAADPDAVEFAFAGPPALHRYKTGMARLIVAAAGKVLADYEGDASRIWAGEISAKMLEERLRAFAGIGQKIGAMAVAQSAFELGIPVSGLDGLDVAVDRHVIRVFVRTGLADRPDHEHVVHCARDLCPTQPHALDLPAWRVGERWCHAGVPNCSECVLRDVCPKLLDRPTADLVVNRISTQPESQISSRRHENNSNRREDMSTIKTQRSRRSNQRQPHEYGPELVNGDHILGAIHADGQHRVIVSLHGNDICYRVEGPSAPEEVFSHRQGNYRYTGLTQWTKENLGGKWRWELADLSKTRFS